MATAAEVAQKGLKRLLVQADEAPLEASEYADFYSGMNDFMAELEANGLVLGYTAVDSASDEVTVPDGAIGPIAANVAVEVAAEYGAEVSASLARSANRGMNTLRKIARPKGRRQYPPTLPRGAGNRGESPGYNSVLYGTRVSALLSLAGNTRITSMGGLTGQLVKVNGFWEILRTENVTADITGRVQFTGEVDQTYRVKVDVKAKGSGSIAAAVIALVVNGDRVNLPAAQFITTALSSTPSEHTLTASLRFQPGDYVELWVGDTFTSADITVMDAKLELY